MPRPHLRKSRSITPHPPTSPLQHRNLLHRFPRIHSPRAIPPRRRKNLPIIPVTASLLAGMFRGDCFDGFHFGVPDGFGGGEGVAGDGGVGGGG